MSRPIDYEGEPEYFDHFPVFIKFIINLRRLDTNANTQNVIAVYTFPVDVEFRTASSIMDPAFQNFTATSNCGIEVPPPVSYSDIHSFCEEEGGDYKVAERGFPRYAQNLLMLEQEEAKEE